MDDLAVVKVLDMKLPKSVLIKYESLELDEKIGAGAGGQVYRGTWKRNAVAIKVCRVCAPLSPSRSTA